MGHSANELSALPKVVESIMGMEITAVSLAPQYTVVATGAYENAIRSNSTVMENSSEVTDSQ